ncbi:AraC family transcriptional regulator [Paracoccus suum]|nr:AraC family transcriptional regulator [Paracoccus suum]
MTDLPPVPKVRSYVLAPYVEALSAAGKSLEPTLRRYGIEPEIVHQIDELIPLENFLAITEIASQLADDNHLGLRLGANLPSQQLGAQGVIIRSGKNLGVALASYANWATALQEATQFLFTRQRHDARFIYRLGIRGPYGERQDIEFTLGNLFNLIRARMGQSWRPTEMHFEHSAPTGPRQHERVFGCPVYFDRPVNMLVLPLSDLEKEGMSGTSWRERAMIPLLQEHVAKLTLSAENHDSLARRIAMTVDQSLGRERMTLVAVADKLNMSVRTLQRRLEAEGTTFREVLGAERQRVAEGVLRNRETGRVLSAAIRAGYSDASSLSRAYKRRTGKKPSKYSRGWES